MTQIVDLHLKLPVPLEIANELIRQVLIGIQETTPAAVLDAVEVFGKRESSRVEFIQPFIEKFPGGEFRVLVFTDSEASLAYYQGNEEASALGLVFMSSEDECFSVVAYGKNAEVVRQRLQYVCEVNPKIGGYFPERLIS